MTCYANWRDSSCRALLGSRGIYFRPIARSGSQPPPSGSESLECSSSQATQITVSTSTIDDQW